MEADRFTVPHKMRWEGSWIIERVGTAVTLQTRIQIRLRCDGEEEMFLCLQSNSILRAGSQSLTEMAELILDQRPSWEAGEDWTVHVHRCENLSSNNPIISQ